MKPRAAVLMHRWAMLVATATFVLIFVGGLVTSTGSGLAVPDWPLSFGQVFPRMEGGVVFEHGHRLLAATVGVLTVILAIWISRVEERQWVRALGWSLVGVVILQGVLGGLTVLLRLPDSVSVAHAGLAQIFFALTVTTATVLDRRQAAGSSGWEAAGGGRQRTLALVTALIIYTQILIGAVVRHIGAGLAIPDFPLSFGQIVPPFTTYLVAWQFAHRACAVVASVMILWTAIAVAREHRGNTYLTFPAAALPALVAFQILLGALTIWTRRAVIPTTAHVATGALLFATTVMLATRLHRVSRAAAGTGAGLAAQGAAH